MDKEREIDDILKMRADPPDAPQHLSAQIIERTASLPQKNINDALSWKAFLNALDEFFLLPQPVLTLGALLIFAISLGMYVGNDGYLGLDDPEINLAYLALDDDILSQDFLMGEL